MKIFALLFGSMITFAAYGQNNEGSIEYEELIKIQMDESEIPDEFRQYASMMPKERRTNMVLHFNQKASMYELSSIPVETEANPFGGQGRNMRMRVMGGRESSQTYIDIKKDEGVRFEDMMGKKFLIEQPQNKIKWKLTNIQEEVAGYTCIKATAIIDSNEVIAWFSPQIPVPTGPQGINDLPGAILKLEMQVNRGFMTILAKEIRLEPLTAEIKEPTKGEKVTEREFEEMMRAKMDEMTEMYKQRRESGGGGGERQIIIGGGN